VCTKSLDQDTPLTADRERARHIIGADAMLEVHMATPLATCEARDAKGLYKKARAGELPDFTGVSAPYEAPIHPQLVFDTSALSVEDCVHTVLHLLNV
jgi:adenylylsulfate kinase